MKERREFISTEVQHMQASAISGQKMPATSVTVLSEQQVTSERTIYCTSDRDTTEATALRSTSMPDVFDEAVVWVDNCTAHSFLASHTTFTLVRTLHFRARLQPHPLRTQSFTRSRLFCMNQLLMRTVRIVGLYKGQAIWTASTCLCFIENFASEVCLCLPECTRVSRPNESVSLEQSTRPEQTSVKGTDWLLVYQF